MNEIENYNEKTFESIKHIDKNGNEYWEARELQQILGYKEWRYFSAIIEKAQVACSNSNNSINCHFGVYTKIVSAGVTSKPMLDYKLSRYACYLIVQNANPKFKAVALGQTYFAVQTRNLAYITKIFSSQYISGKGRKQFRTSKKHIQINFNNYNYPKNREISINRLKDIDTNEELTDLIEIHHVNLEVIKKNCYNKSDEELTAIERIVKFLKAEDIDDMEKQVGEGMKSILDKVMELSSDERLIGLYNKEELDAAREYGMHLAGKEEGIKQNQKQVVINMLKKNIDINTISEITELSKEDIDELINEIEE